MKFLYTRRLLLIIWCSAAFLAPRAAMLEAGEPGQENVLSGSLEIMERDDRPTVVFVSPSSSNNVKAAIEDDTKAIQESIDALSKNARGGTIVLSAGIYRISGIKIHASNIALVGAGSKSTLIQKVPGADSSNCIEVGVTAMGAKAPAFENVAVSGLSIAGDRDRSPMPATDLTEWGIAFTKTRHSRISDVIVSNCWNGGIGIFIDSDNDTVDANVMDCGLGNRSTGKEPGIDVNASNNCTIVGCVYRCPYGVRVLNNCIGNRCNVKVYDSQLIGFLLNGTGLPVRGNTVDALVSGGCSDWGVTVNGGATDNYVTSTIFHVRGGGLKEAKGLKNSGNIYRLCTIGSGLQGAYVGGDSGYWSITSVGDGMAGSPGSSFAVDVYGSGNFMNAFVSGFDGRARGLMFRVGACNNKATFSYVATDDAFADLGDNNLAEVTGLGIRH